MSSLATGFFLFICFFGWHCVPSVLDKDNNHQDKDDNVEGQDRKDGTKEGILQ